MLNRLLRLWATVRHLSPKQILYRGRRVIRHRLWRWRQPQAPQTPAPPLTAITPLFTGLADLSDANKSNSRTSNSYNLEVAEHVCKAEEIAQQRFAFLDHEVTYINEIAWHDPEQSHLWRFNLHYFDYVNDLLVWGHTGQPQAACDTFQKLATSWIVQNNQLGGDGWHPYTLSLRSVNWTQALVGFPEELWDPSTRDQIQASLFGQVQLLASDLEFDIRGNHLLENLRALIWAGVSFSGKEAQGWLARGLKILQAEIEEQILPDGGHFERVPGYHLVMLKCLLEIALFLRRNRETVSIKLDTAKLDTEWLDSALERMTIFAQATLPPDGQTALLKDTAWDTAPQAANLFTACALYFDDSSYKYTDPEKFRAASSSLEMASTQPTKTEQTFSEGQGGDVNEVPSTVPPTNIGLYPYLLWGEAGQAQFTQWHDQESVTSETPKLREDSGGSQAAEESVTDYFPNTGYWVVRNNRLKDYLIMDVGKPGPDYLLGHAHADLLSYELTIDGARAMVDSGVYQYEAGAWRDYSRSTRAHNTVEIASTNQSDVWSSFRVGQRAKPRVLRQIRTDTYALMQAEHDGYARLPQAAIHRRTLLWVPDQFWLIFDQIRESGTNPASTIDAANHIHLHPALMVAQITDSTWKVSPALADSIEQPNAIEQSKDRAPFWISAVGHSEATIACGETEPRLQGWYSEKFGQQQANTVLTLNQKAQLPFGFGYIIAKHMPVQNILNAAGCLHFEHKQKAYKFDPDGLLEVVESQ